MDLRHNLRQLSVALIALSLAFGAGALAQSGAEPVQFIVAPEQPGPNQLVSIEVQGVGGFLGDATVTWAVNGKTVKTGTGVSTFTFMTGPLGKTTNVAVTIQSGSYGTITRSFSFTPSQIDLLWEADTSVPPLYRGKALYSAGARVRVVALPHVSTQGALSYKWTLDETPDLAQSGIGRSTFVFDGNQLHDGTSISVDVLAGGSAVGHADLFIPATDPKILLYDRDPLRGVLYDQELGDRPVLTDAEGTVHAEPYFFSRGSFANGSLAFAWQLNDEDTAGPQSAQGDLTLRQTGTGAGSATLLVSLQNLDDTKLLQSASREATIVFGQTKSSIATFLGL